MKAGSLTEEAARQEAVQRYDILDTPPEQEFDDLAVLAARICSTPISIISLTDGDREWFKTHFGVSLTEIPRDVSFCSHISREERMLIVPNALEDERFAHNPFVVSEPHFRFYAGTSLVTPEGETIGALCVLDTRPRELSPEQVDALQRLARQVVALLEASPDDSEERGRTKKERRVARTERRAEAASKAREDEERLRDSEERYRRLFETARDGIVILDAQTGVIENLNPFICELLSVKSEDLMGRPVWEVNNFRNLADNQNAFNRSVKEAFFRFENLTLWTKRGQSISTEIVGNTYSSGGKQVIQFNIRDMTSHKEAVTEQERFFALSLDWLCIMDMNGSLIRVNPTMARMLGYSSETLKGLSSFDFIHPDDFEKSGLEMGRMAAGYPVTNFVNRYRCRNGGYRSILWDTASFGDRFYAAGRDITERIEAEEILQGSQRFLQSTLDALASHIAVLDEQGTIVAVNLAWKQFASENNATPMSCGVGANYLGVCEAAGGPWLQDAPRIERGIREVMAGRQMSFCLEYPCPSESEERWFSMCVTRFSGEGPLRLAVAHDDITERKRAENTIRTSAANLAKAQQIAHLGSWEFDLSDSPDLKSNVLLWSDEVFRIFGMEPGEITPSYDNYFAGIHPDERDYVEGILLDAIEGKKQFNVEHSIVRKDGTERYVHIESGITFDAAGKPLKLVGTVQDITESKASDEALRKSELRYRALAEAAPDDIFIIQADGVLEYVNRHAAERLNVQPHEIIGKTEEALAAENKILVEHAAIQRVIETGEPWYEESKMPLHDHEVWRGTWLVPLKDYESNVLSVMGVARDISGQKQAEATLRASEARYRSLFESNPHPMWVIDLETRRFLAVNDAAIDHYGYSREEFLSMEKEKLFPAESVEAMKVELATPSPEGGKRGIWRHLKKDGTPIDVEITTHELNFEDRRARLTLAHDITARLAAEKALNQVNEELERRVEERTAELAKANELMRIENIQHQVTMGTLRQAAEAFQQAKNEADRANAAKSVFLSRMSHELRTPLNAILGFGQILEKQDLTPLGRESVSYILKGGNHLLSLINEVLDIARLESGRLNLSLEPISLAEVIPEACALMRPLAAERSVQLEENLDELSNEYILADRQRFKQVLINLLANAIKYNREGGQVNVVCRAAGPGRTIISVRDTGVGMASEDLPKLFTAFERLNAEKSEIEGTGLGLVLSQRLVVAMGGTIKVESKLGEGTTLILDFPETSAPEAQVTNLCGNNGRRHYDEDARNCSVLCIEDNPSNLRLIEVVLQSRPDIALSSALEGMIGLNMARQNPPDLILLDLNLPDMGGKEVLERLQQSETTRGIPVVIVSADATPNQIDRLMNIGAKAYLTKPLNIGEFLQTLDDLLAKPSSRNQPIDAQGVV